MNKQAIKKAKQLAKNRRKPLKSIDWQLIQGRAMNMQEA